MSRMFPLRKSIVALLVVWASLTLSGCSSFNRQWNQAANQPPPKTDLEGRWEGSWQSEVNGHHGKLRCLISSEPDGLYRARFHAKYARIFSFGYTVKLRAESDDGRLSLKGEADLGFLAGGIYRYEGHVDRTNFFAKYACKYDHGTFQMKRPESARLEGR